MKLPTQKSFTILGIDQSLSGTGLTAIRANFPNVEVVQTAVISSKKKGFERLEEIISGMKAMVQEINPDLVVMEDVTRMAASASLSALVELAGILRLELYRMGIPAVIQNQSSMKKFSFGSGDTKKDSGYMLKVYDSTGERFATDDQADAFLHARLLANIVWIARGEQTFDGLKGYQRDTLLAKARKESKLTDSKFKKLDNHNLMYWFVTSHGIPWQGLREELRPC